MKYLGYIGIFCIQASYIPQTWRVIRTGNISGLSPLFLLMLWLGLALLQVYSYAAGDWIYILSNWLGLVNVSVLLAIVYRGRR